MTTTTSPLGLTLYNSSAPDTATSFLNWRLSVNGPTSSGFTIINDAIVADRARLTTLEALKTIIPVNATYSSGSLFVATVAAITSYVDGMYIGLVLNQTNVGVVTVNFSSLGVRSLAKLNTSGTAVALDANDLILNRTYLFKYDLASTNWYWVGATSGSQLNVPGTSGNLATVSTAGTLIGTLTQSLMISQTIHAETAKTTPIDTDEIGIVDSAASNVLKRVTWANLKATLTTAWGAQIAAATAKTTPVGADLLGLVDSAASNATKSFSFTNLVAYLKTAIATDTLASPTDITTNNASTSFHGFLKKLSGGTADTMRGDGTWGGIYAPEGFLQNGQINVTVASNNITVAIKTLAGSNPSATDPVYIRINNNIRTITAALSVTASAGTNWFNSGGTELATKSVDYFVYLGYNATDGVVIGFSRIPYARQYSTFSVTTTNEKYAKISTITTAASTDYYEVIGRFEATLSATASFNWSVPTYTATNLINYPIYETRLLSTGSAFTGFSTPPTITGTYQIVGRNMAYGQVTSGVGTSNQTYFTSTLPFSPSVSGNSYLFLGVDSSVYAHSTLFVTAASNIMTLCKGATLVDTSWTGSGSKYAFINASFPIG